MSISCPKCGAESGDDWSQCEGACPMPGSPHHNPLLTGFPTMENDSIDEAVSTIISDAPDDEKPVVAAALHLVETGIRTLIRIADVLEARNKPISVHQKIVGSEDSFFNK